MGRIIAGFVVALVLGSAQCWAQQKSGVIGYFKNYIGLANDEIAAIRGGQAVVKTLRSRTPDEIFVFGAVYINAAPDAYIGLASDFDRLRKQPGNVAMAAFSSPPRIADLNGFTFESADIESLKKCKPRNCDVQMPESSMKNINQLIDWSAPNAADQINQMLQQTAIKRLSAYQQEGDRALGIYNDKKHPTDVAGQFRYILSYSKALPEYLPALYNYLLSYPGQRPANVGDSFYWAKVKFGLKPTLRIVHVVTLRGQPGDDLAYAIAEKQLYASHYFQTALDLTFCILDRPRPAQQGFYLIKVMGSEQAGLTGFKGSFIRRAAVGRSASALKKSLAATKDALERRH